MSNVALLEITPQSDPASLSCSNEDLLTSVSAACLALYDSVGFQRPWICFFAELEGRVVGTCGFKGPPGDGKVEIAYFTFPGEESRGIATSMALLLIEASRCADPGLRITAQTLVDRNASHRILEKLGFRVADRLHDPEDGDVLEWELPKSPPGSVESDDKP